MTETRKKQFGTGEVEFADHLEALFKPEDEGLQTIRRQADAAGIPPVLHVGPFDGLHLEILTRAVAARKVVEIGTAAGYSGTCFLRGMPGDGKLYTFEFNPARAEIAREIFAKQGYSQQVQVFAGPAIETLPKIEIEGPFDLVFVDADKKSYPKYFAWAERYLRVGGMLLGDNTFAFGDIHLKEFKSPRQKDAVGGLQEFNRLCAESKTFRSTILPTGEGLTMAVKVREPFED